MRAVLSSLVRHRLESEASRLQSRYDQLKIAQDARPNVFVVADFEAAIAKQLGSQWSTNLFRVFIFAKDGELRKQWNDVPSAEELAAALK